MRLVLLSNDSKTNLKVTPVEVKSSKNYTTLSYAKFKKRFGRRIDSSMVVHPKAFSENETGMRLPTYMLFCVFE